ncbi:hypothetical protein T05_10914 [Trichinella murrelli]|uniref:Uncharacterized protein n=1 Tax=Trichinella murrelli TaxID=144512 RepID=A0A0V0TPM8_9BILA|nr:hypothetical protein T05_10914 [Trichinella murrelli]
MPKLMKGATPNELVKRCDGRSDVNHWMKSIRASETITQKHSDAYRSSWGDLYVTQASVVKLYSEVYVAFNQNAGDRPCGLKMCECVLAWK